LMVVVSEEELKSTKEARKVTVGTAFFRAENEGDSEK
jgi:hypothetical protein